MKNIDDSIKEQINREGFEGNCAVLIGTPGEMPTLREKLESNGYTNDLETYIRLNKRVVLPKEVIERGNPSLYKWVSENKGSIWCKYPFSFPSVSYRYVDKEGGITEIKIDPLKVRPLKIGIDRICEFHNSRYNEYNLCNKNHEIANVIREYLREDIGDELRRLRFDCTHLTLSLDSNKEREMDKLEDNLKKEREYYKEQKNKERFDF